MKPTGRGYPLQFGQKNTPAGVPKGHETNVSGEIWCISRQDLVPLYSSDSDLSRKKHQITLFYTIIVDLHVFGSYTCVVGTGLLSTSRRKPTKMLDIG